MQFLVDGWMNFNFASFSTAFQSYQDDERVIMKGWVLWNPVYDKEDLRLRRSSNLDPQINKAALKLPELPGLPVQFLEWLTGNVYHIYLIF